MDLFNQKTNQELNHERTAQVPGLSLHENFLSKDEEQVLVRWIDEQPWLTELKRRVQHYGYRYDYKARRVNRSMYLGVLPPALLALASKIKDNGLISFLPDQAIINEYEPGQGIAEHIDCEPCFGDTIVSLSLLSQCVMTFRSTKEQEKSIDLLLHPRTVLVMEKEARYEYKHGIASRQKDSFNGTTNLRQRRLSITYRKVIASF
jgi:alkylated DNA repair dioxygenase AlkB